MNPIIKIFYLLTAYIPRRLPATPEQYQRFKYVMMNAYGLPDEPPIWITVSGQTTSHEATSLRRAWGLMANAAKRLQINNLAQFYKAEGLRELNRRLEDAVKRESERIAAEEALNGSQNAQVESQENDQSQSSPTQGNAQETQGSDFCETPKEVRIGC